jgi:malonyl-CoA/methylmalonyl-CoA synthetase
MDPGWAIHLPSSAAGVEVERLAGCGLPQRWLERWSERPSWPQLRNLDGRWLPSGELEERSRELAGRLRGAGLEPGERLVLSGAASASLVIALLGALRAGAVVVPLNPAYTAPEVGRIVGDAEPSLALVDDSERGAAIAAAAAGPVALHGLDGPLGVAPVDELIDSAGPRDPALLIYTSGTTGRPKGVPLSHANLLSSATAVQLAWRWTPEDRLLLTLPLFHVHGLGVGLIGTLCAGASAELRRRFAVEDVLERAGSGEISLLFGVPTIYQRLAACGRAAELSPLRLLVSGSAPLPAALARELGRATGRLPLERYGMTETVMLTSNPYEGERRPGTVGFPLPGVELRLAAGSGEIEVRGPGVIGGYWRAPEADADAFTADGFFRTGDLGELDEAGYLRIAGRVKELIISGGFNVYPREVEERLLEHPAVREAAVIGRPSQEWGEEVVAVVVLERSVSASELRAHAAAALTAYKVPKRFEFADGLPRNALGKIVRGEL